MVNVQGNTINELIELTRSGKMSVNQAAEAVLASRVLGYAVRNFEPTLSERPTYLLIAGRYGEIKPKVGSAPVTIPVTTRADCGHMISKSQIMNTSRGTSCMDCYDKMSE